MTAFLADENIPYLSISKLREGGHDITSIGLESPSVNDEVVVATAAAQNRIIITCDRDFGELIFKRGKALPAGLIYFRIGTFQPEEPAEIILRYLAESPSIFDGYFSVITRKNIRRRQL